MFSPGISCTGAAAKYATASWIRRFDFLIAECYIVVHTYIRTEGRQAAKARYRKRDSIRVTPRRCSLAISCVAYYYYTVGTTRTTRVKRTSTEALSGEPITSEPGAHVKIVSCQKSKDSNVIYTISNILLTGYSQADVHVVTCKKSAWRPIERANPAIVRHDGVQV